MSQPLPACSPASPCGRQDDVSLAVLDATHFVDAAVGQLVGTLVAGMADMTAYPLPFHGVSADLFVQLLPEIGILDRFLGRGFPAALLPVDHPLGDAFHHVLRVGDQRDFAGTLELFEAADGAGQFHAVVGGVGFAAPQLFFDALADQQCAPAAGAGVAFAGAVSEEFYAIAHYNLSRMMGFMAGVGRSGLRSPGWCG